MRIHLPFATALIAGVLASTACTGPNSAPDPLNAPTVTVTATPEAADEAEPDGTPDPTVTVTATETVTATPEPEVEEGDYGLPEGYPEVVSVTELPQQIQSAFRSHDEAVALAPGVWTALPEGATIESAVEAGGHMGWCASIDAFVSEYRDGQRSSGTCW